MKTGPTYDIIGLIFSQVFHLSRHESSLREINFIIRAIIYLAWDQILLCGFHKEMKTFLRQQKDLLFL